jgi:flavodoxin
MVMKKVIFYGLIISLCIMSACSKGQSPSSKKILIVYLTRTKNTEAVARMIQKEVGGKLVVLELVSPYPTDYRAHVAQMVQENQENFLPPLKTKIDSIGQYDIVFVGFPTWDMKIPPPMKTFLKQYDLSGKTVVPFNTNAGYGVGSSFETVKELCTKSKVLDGYSTKGGIERDGILFVMKDDKERTVKAEVQEWLKKIGLIN